MAAVATQGLWTELEKLFREVLDIPLLQNKKANFCGLKLYFAFLAAPSSSRSLVVSWLVRSLVGRSETFVKKLPLEYRMVT